MLKVITCNQTNCILENSENLQHSTDLNIALLSSMAVLAILLIGLASLAAGWDQFSLASQTCSGQHQSLTLTPGANAWLSMLVPQRSKASDIAGYGCGDIRGDAQPLEAVRWILDVLNQNSGTINGVNITQSYIPGITLGKLLPDATHQ